MQNARDARTAGGESSIENSIESTQRSGRPEATRQTIKWVVYSLLVVNWGYYIFDDWRVAQHTLSAGDGLLEYLNAYATSLDELAWFAMLFLFEAETYWLSDDQMSRFLRFSFVGLRFTCYAFLAHTVYAYVFNYFELVNAPLLHHVASVCDLSDQAFSFVRNLAYTSIDTANCGSLSNAGALFQIGGDSVVSDAAGVAELKFLYAVDIEDALVWLSVVLTIEFVVLLQERGISEGPLINACNYLTFGLYGVLVCNALIWFWKGHYVYGWDQLLWIGGFAAIEMNLSEWRDELNEEAAAA